MVALQKKPKGHSLFVIINHSQDIILLSSPSSRFLLEVSVCRGGGGDGVQGGRERSLSRPVLPGAAGGPALQVQCEPTRAHTAH